MRINFRWLCSFLKGDRLFPFEEKIIEAVATKLPRGIGNLLRRQVGHVNKIQRIAGGKEVNLYHARLGKTSFDKSLLFNAGCNELLMASANISVGWKKEKLRVEMWVAGRRFFSLLYSQNPVSFFAPQDTCRDFEMCIDIISTVDPTLVNRRFSSGLQKTLFPVWFQKIISQCDLIEYEEPFSDEDRERYLRGLNTLFPSQYIEIATVSEFIKFDKFVFYGPSHIREFVVDCGSYLVLVETEMACVTVRSGYDKEMKLYVWRFEFGVALESPLFSEALIEMLEL